MAKVHNLFVPLGILVPSTALPSETEVSFDFPVSVSPDLYLGKVDEVVILSQAVWREKVIEISGMGQDWDGFGSPPIPKEAIDAALQFLDQISTRDERSSVLEAITRVVPSVEGAVGIYLGSISEELYLEIDAPESYLLFVLGGDEGEVYEPSSLVDLIQCIERHLNGVEESGEDRLDGEWAAY